MPLKAALRDPFSDIASKRPRQTGCKQSRSKSDTRAPLTPWIRNVGWFLYGNFLYALCEAILRRSGAEESGDAFRDALLTLKQDEMVERVRSDPRLPERSPLPRPRNGRARSGTGRAIPSGRGGRPA